MVDADAAAHSKAGWHRQRAADGAGDPLKDRPATYARAWRMSRPLTSARAGGGGTPAVPPGRTSPAG